MLPLPSSSSSRKSRMYFPSLPNAHNISSSQQLLQTLRSRTRLTNLAVTLLFLLLTTSLLLNFNHYLFTPTQSLLINRKSHLRGGHDLLKGWDDSATPSQIDSGIPLSIETTIERDIRYGELNHLIMVPGHAIWLGHDANRAREDDDWVLEGMQKGGSVKTFVKHIERGVEELKEDQKALLIFSGGVTRLPPSPPMSEGLSYHRLATALDLLPPTSHQTHEPGSKTPTPLPHNLRTATEEYAMDSYENLLFSVARFKEVSGRWPERITVVGYGMKRRRFQNLHRAALNFPSSNFTYIGIDDEGDTTAHYAGEQKYGYSPFLASPSGCHPPLSIKRLVRNPYMRYHPYHVSCPEIVDLLEWCPPLITGAAVKDDGGEGEGQKFPGWVPWLGPIDSMDKGREKGEVMWDRERW
ncbi:hypothetical protein CI109_106567 [Kwoniella shandongensis]|uniref:Uncharacterized protein n=1 Tax=Kwoniella shandongensis TaxID=1734106 RepID=A0A5M6C2X6_9TREE|nr:uncharacterized protein CI109_002748 [Kwoniella shandongensis]KAA5528990.1 hypothetical protein CI109_002748 [Kwoniella shandongensis]